MGRFYTNRIPYNKVQKYVHFIHACDTSTKFILYLCESNHCGSSGCVSYYSQVAVIVCYIQREREREKLTAKET